MKVQGYWWNWSEMDEEKREFYGEIILKSMITMKDVG
tara:strand:+ start:443 stop:553 length:111 start_codon:yes stop_codon:yes gene_type:complete